MVHKVVVGLLVLLPLLLTSCNESPIILHEHTHKESIILQDKDSLFDTTFTGSIYEKGATYDE